MRGTDPSRASDSAETRGVKAIALLLMISGCSLYFSDPSDGGPAPMDAAAPLAKRVFVTSTRYPGGALGGLVGADAKCNERAAAAGLSGDFKAWLSDATTSAAARMTHSSGPYTLVDGTLVANTWTELVGGSLERSIDRDETNQPYDSTVPFFHPSWNYNLALGAKAAWTGTMYDGRADSFDCTGYPDCACIGWNDVRGRSLAGDAISATANWTEGGGVRSCADLGALYCLEQ
jgi:hypothetical protein